MAKDGWVKSTRVASVRLDLDAWEHLDEWAAGEGLNVNDKLKELVDAYIHPPPEPRVPGKTSRWALACGEVSGGLDDLRSIQDEYREWLDNMPENFQASTTAQKLEQVIDLDVESVLLFVDEAESIDLPLGFGRD